MNLEARKVARNLAIRKRFLSLTANEQIKSQNLYIAIISFLHLLRSNRLSVIKKHEGIKLVKKCMLYYIHLNLEPTVFILSRPGLNRTIDSFSDSECWNYFETRKNDLARLLAVLRFPERCLLANNSVMRGEELMLRGLYELVSGTDQYEIGNMFGLEQPQQSLAFKFFVNHIYSNFLYIVTDNLDWWYNNGYLHASMTAIKQKFGGNDRFSTFGFIDCNCLETATPGGGPVEQGNNNNILLFIYILI
jgi:hypothetical protein